MLSYDMYVNTFRGHKHGPQKTKNSPDHLLIQSFIADSCKHMLYTCYVYVIFNYHTFNVDLAENRFISKFVSRLSAAANILYDIR